MVALLVVLLLLLAVLAVDATLLHVNDVLDYWVASLVTAKARTDQTQSFVQISCLFDTKTQSISGNR